jgi:transposase
MQQAHLPNMVDERIKYQLINACDQCQNFSDVARRFKVDRRTVRLWVQRYKETSDVCARPRSGRPTSLNGSGALEAKELLTSGKLSSAKDVANKLLRLGVSRGAAAIQASTVIVHARAAAKATGKPIQFTRKFPTKRLTPRTQQPCLAFCKANKDTTWPNVMFSDRSKHHFWYPGEVVHTSGRWCEQG